MNRRVLIVEDDPLVVRGWRRALQSGDWEVCAAGTLHRATEMLDKERWRVVVLDLQLPDGDGADLLPVLDQLTPKPTVVVASGYVSAKRVAKFHRLPALAIPKPMAGNVLQRLLEMLDADASQEPTWVGLFCHEHKLSPRQSEQLRIAADGSSDSEIAQRMGIKIGTVSSNWERIRFKTQCDSRLKVLAALFRYREKLLD